MNDPLSELSRLTAEKDYVPTEVGLSAGSEGADVTRLQRYLQKFGYIAPTTQAAVAPEASPTSGVFDERTVEALERFQQFNGLPVTGELDAATLDLMSRPRCGFPDHFVESFAVVGEKWDHTDLTYAYQNFTPDLTETQISLAISQAFSLWAAVVPLTFTEVALGASPDIIIRFVAGAHGDGSDFDGPGGVYAHAFYPTIANGPLAGDAHFDEDETWSIDLPPTGVDLVSVAAHEFGHSLGLLHSDVTSALMYAFYTGAHRNLETDDVEGIQSIYGRRTTTLISDDFSGAFDEGGPYWVSASPDPPFPGVPYTSGGLLVFENVSYLSSQSVTTYPVWPLRCTASTVVIDNYPLAEIMANDFMSSTPIDISGGSAGQNSFRWNITYFPTTLVPPETPSLYDDVILWGEAFIGYPPVASYHQTPVLVFSNTDHKYLRITEGCHDITWQYSADGITWTDHDTTTLDDGYIYTSNYRLTISKREGYGGAGGVGFTPYNLTFESAEIGLVDDCPCKPTGWHIGRVGSGGPF